jgi:DUF3071 family protein
MRQLQFVGVSDDGAHLLLQDSGNAREQFLVPIDERLRAASRGDRSRLGQIELELEKTLRPREIQARIRAGESPEAVAEGAGAPLERVMRFAYPVLQEREQVTIEARRTRIRRSVGSSQLGEQVDERLARQGVDPEAADWDAYRREDGSWWLTLSWMTGKTPLRAQWSFDLAGRTLTPADDQAAELQAEQPRRRQIAAVPFVPDNDDDDDDDEPAVAEEPPAAPVRRQQPVRRDPVPPQRERPRSEPYGWAAPISEPASQSAVPPVPEPAIVEPEPEPEPEVEIEVLAVPEPVAPVQSEPEDVPEEPAADEPKPAAKAAKSGRKPKVPSWDDIVFGTRSRR